MRSGGSAAGASIEVSPDTEAGPAPVVGGHVLRHRWVYVPTNLQVDDNVRRVKGVLDRARACGFNGVLLADVKLGRLDDGSLPARYHANLAAVLEHAVGIGMAVVPNTADFGYSESILWHDPNLAEGLPVRGAEFRAQDRTLVPHASAPVGLANGDFEDLPTQGHAFPGWSWQDGPGTATFVDRNVVHGGRASLRMEELGVTNAPHGNGRIQQRLSVQPYQYYHVEVWVRTSGFRGGDVRVLALGQNPSRTLQWNSIPVEATQDWARFDVTFNTLTHAEVLFYLGVWGGERGTIWWDDARIEPAGFVNVIRRPGAPLALRSADGSVAYVEGRDTAQVVDPRMGRAPWPGSYDLWHEPPYVGLPEGSRIREGEILLADYYHMATVYGGQVTASLTEPAVLDVVRRQLSSLARSFGDAAAFRGWMLGYDEIRVGGWDAAPRPGTGTPGEQLAHNVRMVHAAARAIEPEVSLYTWSDMFDPHHNAAVREAPYYLVNGDWSGSWEGLPADVTVLNWNHQGSRRRPSAEFFASRGHRQILAGYYDADPSRFADRAWLEELTGVPGVDGVLYTHWSTGYEHLEAWAQHVWGDAPWTSPTATPASAESARGALLPAVARGARR